MIVLSLFDGISCGQMALKRIGGGIERYYASEIDKYAIKITRKNFPETIQLGDVNNFEEWDLPQIDLLIGGSPCQDLSIAKQDRKGLDGERSGLFWRYVDCLHKFKPKYFLLENVASMPKEAKETITKTLGVEPIMINSALVSAQQRKRLYWTNIPNVDLPEDKGIVLKDILLSGADERKFNLYNETEIGDKAPTLTSACGCLTSSSSVAICKPVGVGQTKEEKSYSLTATYAGAILADTIKKNRRTMVAEPIRIPKYGAEDKSRPLTSNYQNNCGGWIDRINDPNPAKQQVDLIAEPVILQRAHGFNKGGVKSEKSPSLTANGFYEQNNFVCERVDKDKIDLVAEPKMDTQKSIYVGEIKNNGYKNGKQSSMEYRIYSVKGKSLSLNGFQTNYKIDLPDGDYIIRKLYPLECERLQTLPDNYTLCEGVSNTQRYKCIGNAWTVDVIAHILKNIF